MVFRYEQEVQKYGKKDSIIALCACLVIAVLTVALWAIAESFELARLQSSILQLTFSAIVIGIAVTIVLIRKQGLASIGIHKDKLWPTLRFGLLFILIFSALGVVPGLIYGWEFNSLRTIIALLFMAIVLAAQEDIFFTGYLQTRLYGLFKKDVLAILVGAVLFALVHIPVGLFSDMNMVFYMVTLCISHVCMVLIFRVYFSIIPVIIVHTLQNFLNLGDLWSVYNPDYNSSWVMTAALPIWVLMIVLEIIRFRRRKKASAAFENKGCA